MTTNSQTTQTTTVYETPEPVVRPLPIGVAILAILIGIVGFFFLLVGVLAIFGVLFFHGYLLFGGGLLAALITLIVGIVLLAVAGGLWNQELWALALAILVLVILLAWNLYDFLFGGPYSILSIVIEAVLLVYLIAVSNRFY
jgi:hypothetical protein